MDEIPLAPLSPKKSAPTSAIASSKTVSKPEPPRRGFFAKFLAVVIGSVAGLVPVAAGLAVWLDPMRRTSGGGQFLRITSLDSLPDDGVPRQFPVLNDRQDAWNRSSNEQIGAVYLRRLPATDIVEAFNAYCPHAGCFVAFKNDRNEYQCPCHTSQFTIEGRRIMPCVSPRDLDSLPCELRAAGDDKVVYVQFINYYSGTAEKIAKT
jgi:menaquinol-cytochrome c reductase iron-sulfur subunit